MLRSIALGLAILLPNTGLGCPVAADLETGIEMRDSEGYRYVFKRLNEHIVQQDGYAPDGYAYRNLLAQGSHVLQLADLEDGALVRDSIINYSYPMQPADMPVPAENLTWQVQVMINSFGDIYPEAQSQSWGSMGKLVIGDCSYDMIPGRLTYKSDADLIREEIHFLPELGLGLLVGYSDGSGYDDTFTYVAIRALDEQ